MNLTEELVAYVHGELTPDQMVKVEQMMERSPEVREEIAALRAIRIAAQELSMTPEPTGKAELLIRLKAEQSDQMVKSLFPWKKLVPYFGTGLGLLMIGIIWMGETSRSSSSQRVSEPLSASADSPSAGFESAKTPTAESEARQEIAANAPREMTRMKSTNQENSKRPEDNEASFDRAIPKPEVGPNPPSRANISDPSPDYFGQRDIIRNGDIAVQVEDAKAAMEEASKLVVAMGGFVQTDSFSGSEDSQVVANLLIKVPAEKFEACKNAIGKMGKVVRQNSSSEDVTAQIANSKGRLQSLADSEAMYIRSLRTARTSGERMEIRARLDAIRTERAGLQEEYKRLKSLADLSTLSIQFEQVKTIEPVDENSNWWSDSWNGASNAFGWVAQNIGRVGIYMLIFAPVWLPIAGFLLWKRKQR